MFVNGLKNRRVDLGGNGKWEKENNHLNPESNKIRKLNVQFWSPQALFAAEVLLLDFPGEFGSI